MKKICIIIGHPSKESYNHALAESYKNGASQSNATVSVIHIGSLNFNPNLGSGYKKRNKPLEPDLLEAIEKIKDANHIVWLFPMWWYGYPAIMKGFIDRTFLPNIAFRYTGKPFPEQLFKGKTARIIITADSPAWYTKWIMRNPAINQLKNGTLKFCGIKPVKVSYIGPVKNSSPEFKQAWLNKVNQLGIETK